MNRWTEEDMAAALAANPALRLSREGSAKPTLTSPKLVEQPPMNPETAKTLALAMSEDELQTSVIDLAHFYRFKVAHFRSVKVTRKDGSTFWQTPVQADGEGFVDLVLIRAGAKEGMGRVIFVELKSERGKTEPAQTEWLTLLKLTQRVEVFLWRPSHWLDGTIEALLR